MSKLYTVQPPSQFRTKLADNKPFFVPNSDIGVKAASYLDRGYQKQKEALFSEAVKIGTKDLGEAYRSLKELDRETSNDDDTSKDMPAKNNDETPFETDMEVDVEKNIERRHEARKENGPDDFEAENDVIIFKTWLDD